MPRRLFLAILATTAALSAPGESRAVDLVALSPQTWDRYVPDGKEVDAVHGDFALANDHVVAVIAHPRRGRNANMTVREVGGCLIDFTRRDRPNDQLSAFYPGAQLRDLRFAGVDVEAPEIYEAEAIDRLFVRAGKVTLRLVAAPREGQPDVEVAYTLDPDATDLTVTTTFRNAGGRPVEVEPVDSVRADRTFEFSPEGPSELFWAYDRHFGQAYGVVPEGRKVQKSAGRAVLLRYPDADGKVSRTLAPGESFAFVRKVRAGEDVFGIVAKGERPANVSVRSGDQPVAGADVVLERGGAEVARGRTDEEGVCDLDLGTGPARLTISEPTRGSKTIEIGADGVPDLAVELPNPGVVVLRITDADGGPIPCKVQFAGVEGTPDPDFGPASGEHAVKNLYYSHDGTFRREIAPGKYDVIVSYGPEHDAVFQTIEVRRGEETPFEARLVRSVKTDGWISSDFHSHASPSGDNTSSQYGRVLNLLCEQIDFAPCTEHNRISTYVPHLERMGAVDRMATCTGMELTGKPLPINHQNAFPLVMRPGLQDNGAPTTDEDPEVQIERLALWDGASEKLVQVNHPDLGWMFFDRDGDGRPDGGFAGMIPHMDVIEVHPPAEIFGASTTERDGRTYNNTVVNWLQLLNQGRRIPGVVNTDAHENFHGSGWLRNYLASPTDDPAEIDTLDVVRAAEQGRVVMTNGPFLEVTLRPGHDGSAEEVGPGEDLAAPGGKATAHVRVQCPNWFDVDRVQVFVNGKPVESLNFTRGANSDRFADGPVKFDGDIPLMLEGDAHVIVATIGEQSKLGRVMGPQHGEDRPVAVSNPIFVDVDGGGFKANGDTLGRLPVKGGR